MSSLLVQAAALAVFLGSLGMCWYLVILQRSMWRKATRPGRWTKLAVEILNGVR